MFFVKADEAAKCELVCFALSASNTVPCQEDDVCEMNNGIMVCVKWKLLKLFCFGCV